MPEHVEDGSRGGHCHQMRGQDVLPANCKSGKWQKVELAIRHNDQIMFLELPVFRQAGHRRAAAPETGPSSLA